MDINKDDSIRKKDKYRDRDEVKERESKRHRSKSPSLKGNRDKDYKRKRRRSRTLSPNASSRKNTKHGETSKDSENAKEPPERKAKETDMLNTRTGGAYIPPARLRMMQAQITDKSSVAYQRLAWEALKKSIHGHINKINVGNIGIIIKELLKENIVRGRGLLCRSVIQAQAASPTFTNVYAALVAAVNSRFPNIGELLLKRLVIQFKRGFRRNDKPTCISSASFIAHLVNQRVAHEILALELLTLLVETPTDDSVEVAIAFLKESGQKLTEVSSKGVNAIFEMLRNILHEGQLDKRIQYMIEVMFQVWKDGFKDHPALIEELELVPEEEQFTHLLMLDDVTDPQDILNVFKFDEKYEENEQKYKALSRDILGSDAESGDEEDGSEESGSEESDDENQDQETKNETTIIDMTGTNLVALRRTIYLTINSSLTFEECAHKLLKMQLKPGQEVELCHMFLDCCAEQRTYEKFYGLLAQRFCNLNRIYIGPFEEIFKDSYATAHRLDTNRLRNVSKFFAHLLFTDSISWEVLECVKLNEEDTTSSSRIYIKILFQELAEYMGLKKLNDRLQDPTLQDAFQGLFPRDNPKNTRFSINFFTSIGLGGLTDELREHLKQMPKNIPPPITDIQVNSDSSSSTSSSSSSSDSSSSDSSSDSSSESEEESRRRKKKDNKNETPKTSETEVGESNKTKDKERWGHDGFYETYGKDARREEPRQKRPEDVFTRPYDRRKNDRQRNEDERSRRGEENNMSGQAEYRQNHNKKQNSDNESYRDNERSNNRNEFNSSRENNERRNRSERHEETSRKDNNGSGGRRYWEEYSVRNVKEDDKRRTRDKSTKVEVDKSTKERNENIGNKKDSREDKEISSRYRKESRGRKMNSEKPDPQLPMRSNTPDDQSRPVVNRKVDNKNINSSSDEYEKRDSDDRRNVGNSVSSKVEKYNKVGKDKQRKKDRNVGETENRKKKTRKQSSGEDSGVEDSSTKCRQDHRREDRNSDDGENFQKDERTRKQKKGKYKETHDDSWGIRRISSIRREETKRYWENHKHMESKEKVPNKERYDNIIL